MTEPGVERFRLSVNGRQHLVESAAGETLLDVLRDRLGLTGTKFGCGIGYCGACTVLIDGAVAHACCLLAATLDEHEIHTIEGLDQVGHLDGVQQAFLDAGAVQCGYCSPGFIMTVRGLLDVVPEPTVAQTKAFLNGNICRCTGFASIVRAAGVAGAAGVADP